MDFLAHPFRLIAVPVLLSLALFRMLGPGFYGGAMYEVYRQSVAASFKYGALAIISIWIMSVISSAICVRGRIVSTIKWSAFSLIYLSSPFVYLMYYRLVKATNINAY